MDWAAACNWQAWRTAHYNSYTGVAGLQSQNRLVFCADLLDVGRPMAMYSLRNIFQVTAAMTAVVGMAAVATVGYLFAVEDYVTQPGSPAYYLGISSLIRDLQVPDFAQGREYFGSVGDGNKAPQSQLSFKVPPEAVTAVWDQMNLQLQALNVQPVGTGPDAQATSNMHAVSPGLREAAYTSKTHDLVLLATYEDSDAGTPSIRFEITHFD
ncbi:hypothetical protein [Paracidovorax sp. MALMAid1276]|uniref:hypothetical protein n=1 Tax=Paracidovorax sp. MALMAid1276 TaxID=3411631 RepID=UPI003B995DA9